MVTTHSGARQSSTRPPTASDPPGHTCKIDYRGYRPDVKASIDRWVASNYDPQLEPDWPDDYDDNVPPARDRDEVLRRRAEKLGDRTASQAAVEAVIEFGAHW